MPNSNTPAPGPTLTPGGGEDTSDHAIALAVVYAGGYQPGPTEIEAARKGAKPPSKENIVRYIIKAQADMKKKAEEDKAALELRVKKLRVDANFSSVKDVKGTEPK